MLGSSLTHDNNMQMCDPMRPVGQHDGKHFKLLVESQGVKIIEGYTEVNRKTCPTVVVVSCLAMSSSSSHLHINGLWFLTHNCTFKPT